MAHQRSEKHQKGLVALINDPIIAADFLEEEGTLQPAPFSYARGLFFLVVAASTVVYSAVLTGASAFNQRSNGNLYSA